MCTYQLTWDLAQNIGFIKTQITAVLSVSPLNNVLLGSLFLDCLHVSSVVIVGSAPVITNSFDFPTKQYALANEKHSLQCHAKGNPRPRVEWYRDSYRLRTNTYYKVTTEKGKDYSTGKIKSVRVTLAFLNWVPGVSEGAYECRATNTFGSDQQGTVVELLGKLIN